MGRADRPSGAPSRHLIPRGGNPAGSSSSTFGYIASLRRPAGSAPLSRFRFPRPFRLQRFGASASACLLGAALALTPLAVALGAGPAEAQTTVKLVGNTGQSDNGTVPLDDDHVLLVATGDHAQGYKLKSVKLKLGLPSGTAPTFTVSIMNSSLTTTLGTLTMQGSLSTTAGLVEFTASGDGIDLGSGEDFGVFLDVTADPNGSATLGITTSSAEDANPSSGWSIYNNRLDRDWNSNSFGPVRNNSVPKVEVYGHKKAQVSTPTPLAPLISNIGQTQAMTASFANDLAQDFTTGSHASGYRLRGVTFDMQKTASSTLPTFDVTIRENNASNRPGQSLGTLTMQGSVPSSSGAVNFDTYPQGIDVQPSTRYWAVINVSSGATGDTTMKRTNTNGENTGGATGWSIGDTRLHRSATSTGGSSWNSGNEELQMAVRGAEIPEPPALTGAAVTDSTLTLTFGASLDQDSVPKPGEFTVKLGTSEVEVTGLAMGATTVTLTLAEPAVRDQTVTVSYARGLIPLQGLSRNPVANFTDHAVTNGTTNRAPVFTPTATNPADDSADSPGSLVSLPADRSGFSDPDSDALTFSVSLSRDDTHVSFFDDSGTNVPRFWHLSKGPCELANLDPPLEGGLAAEVVATLTATDPAGATARITRRFVVGGTFRTATGELICPSLSSAAVTDRMLMLAFEGGGDATPSGLSASEFTVKVAGEVVALAGTNPVTIGTPTKTSGRTTTPVTLTLAEPVGKGLAVTVSHAPGASPTSVGFTDVTVTNSTTNFAPTATYDATKLTKDVKPDALQFWDITFADNEDDASGTELTVTWEAEHPQFLGTVSYLAAQNRFYLAVKPVCELREAEGLPMVTVDGKMVLAETFDTTVTVKATDSGGASVQVQVVARVTWEPSDCPTLSGAFVRGDKLTLAYDQALNGAGSPPSGDSFAVKVRGQRASLATTDPVKISGRWVVLTLAQAAPAGAPVTVSYAVPSGAGEKIQSAAGQHAAAGFTDVSVDHVAGDTTAPELLDGGVTVASPGSQLRLSYDELLDPAHVPAPSAYTAVVAGVTRSFSVVTLVGEQVVLNLAPVNNVAVTVNPGDEVTLTYDADAGGLRDVAGNLAAGFAAQPVTHGQPPDSPDLPAWDGTPPEDGVEPPRVERLDAVVKDAALTLVYERALDPNSTPGTGAFTVRVNGDEAMLATADPMAVPPIVPVEVKDRRVVLTLAEAVDSGDRVALDYEAGASPIRDTSFVVAADFANLTVRNLATDTRKPVLRGAWVEGTTLTLVYDELLHPVRKTDPDWYLITEVPVPGTNGRAIIVTGNVVAGKRVVLTLDTAVNPELEVQLTYTVPPNDRINLIQDLAGNPADPFGIGTDKLIVTHGAPPPEGAPARPPSGGGGGGGGGLPPDTAPDFGTARVPSLVLVLGEAMTPVTLPTATGGNGELTYSLASAPAGLAGLDFNPATRRLSGTPDAAGEHAFTYTAHDADPNRTEADAAVLRFAVTVEESTDALVKRSVRRALAAVGRRALTSALDNIGARFAATVPASGLTLAGKNVRFGADGGDGDDREPACLPDALDGFASDCAPSVQGIADEELLGSSAFSRTLGTSGRTGTAEAPLWAVWGRGDLGSFAGRPEPGTGYEGELRTGWLGIDARAGPWVAGIALSHGTGEAEYSYRDGGASGGGRLETEVTALHPYGRWTMPDGLELRGILGAGRGEARHWPDGGERETGDLSMWMGALGVSRPLSAIAGFDLAMRGDASVARMETDEGPDAVDGLTADSWRLRAGVEASRRIALGGDAALTPFVEVAARRDGGDGLSGTGVEIAGGLRYAAPRLSVEARGRWLAAHSERGAEERGVSVTVRMGPGAHGRGLALSLSPRWGADAGGAEALWRDELPQPAGLSTRDAAAMDASVSYGHRLGPHGMLTPFAETGLAEGDGRRLAFGTRFESSRTDLGVELAAERREDGASVPENLVRLDFGLRF